MLIELETRALKAGRPGFMERLIQTALTQNKGTCAICLFFVVLTTLAVYVMVDFPHLDISGSF